MRQLSDVSFINISAENLDAAADMLNRDQKGELLEMIIEAVRNNGKPQSQDRFVNGVYHQFMSVISRKAAGLIKQLEALDKINEEKKKSKEAKEEPQDISTAPIVNIPPLEEEHHIEPIPIQTIEKEEEAEVEEDLPIPEEDSVITLREGLDVKEIVKDLSDVYIGDGKRAVMDRIKWYTNQYGIPSLDLWNQLKVMYPEIQATKK